MPDVPTATNKAIAQRLIDEFVNQGDSHVIDDVVAPDFVNHPAPPDGQNHREWLKSYVLALRQASPDLRYTIEQLVADGDLVVLWGSSTSTHRRDFMGIPAAGKQTTNSSITMLRLRNGKIVERWNVGDVLSILQQLGARITAP